MLYRCSPVFVAAALNFASVGVWALESDRDQQVVIEANEVVMDFNTGERIYRGNVSVEQGTIRILADEIQLFYDEQRLERAIATGKPAVFRQRPEGKTTDVVGTGRIIELDEVKNIVTFTDEANVRQGQDSIKGDSIVYDMARDTMKVRGTTRTTVTPEAAASTGTSGRSRIVIQPRTIKETTTAAGTATLAASGSRVTSNSRNTAFQAGYVGQTATPAYATRSLSATHIGSLAPGTPVQILATDGAWSSVTAPRGISVWIYGKYVSADAGVGTITGEKVRLRPKPSTASDSAMVGHVNRGQKVRVLTVQGDWKRIQPPAGFSAWVPSRRLREVQNTDSGWLNDWRNALLVSPSAG